MTRIRILIADDHALFRHGLRSLLELQPDIEIVEEVARAADVEAALAAHPCQVLLLDLQMERWSLSDIEGLAPRVAVVVLTASEHTEDALAALRLGARAVVQKRFAVETLLDAIRAAAGGTVWLPAEVQAALAERWRSADRRELTDREREITRLVASGLRNAEIGKRLFISEVTVKTHLNNVFQKLGIRDRVELTLYAIRIGLVAVSDLRR